MSMMTHESRWRLLVGAAPVIGVAFFAWAAAQGEVDVARSPTARAILAAVAALGTAVAWWTAHQLRAKPTVSVSKAGALAQAGQLAASVTLRGRARALPDAVPLVSPDGELCLWFASGDAVPPRDSVRPFLLVDDSGECIVLPAGAEVTGNGSVPASAARSGLGDGAAARGPRPAERLLRNGDRVQVVGHFVAASPESLALQARAASLVARTEASQAQLRSGDPLPFRDLRSAALAGAAFVAAPPFAHHGLLLPVIAAPESGQPLGIRIGADDGEGGVYGLLAVVDSVVLVVSSSLVAWAMLVPR
jgi:hypothetical protein